jgi:hypothetical protein
MWDTYAFHVRGVENLNWEIGLTQTTVLWAGNFSLNHRVQNGSGAHPAYPMGTRGSFPGSKVAVA